VRDATYGAARSEAALGSSRDDELRVARGLVVAVLDLVLSSVFVNYPSQRLARRWTGVQSMAGPITPAGNCGNVFVHLLTISLIVSSAAQVDQLTRIRSDTSCVDARS
jgi:hypothetical protein